MYMKSFSINWKTQNYDFIKNYSNYEIRGVYYPENNPNPNTY